MVQKFQIKLTNEITELNCSHLWTAWTA